jgi:hypothetical protein
MHEEYNDLRFKLEDVQARFEKHAASNPDLRHQVCYCPYDRLTESAWYERLTEFTWEAFIQHNSHLSDGKWQQWHVLNDGRWCGRFSGTGSLQPVFVSLAAEAVSLLERLSTVPGVGESFFISLPPNAEWDTWLRLLYDTGELCGTPEVKPGQWAVPANQKTPLPLRVYWSRPNSSGVSYPLHPECLILATDVFSASVEAVSVFLTPLVDAVEYTDLLNYQYEGYCVPPYLPTNPWEEWQLNKAIGEAAEEFERLSHESAVEIENTHPFDSRNSTSPCYDENYGELRLANAVVKKYKQQSFRQKRVLRSFQEAGWPIRIPNPFDCVNATKTLLDTISQLNKNQKDARLIFEGDGEGGVRWRIPDATSLTSE